MRSAWTRCSATSRPRSRGSTPRPRCCAAPARTRCICSSSAPPSAACAARSIRRSCGSRASTPTACRARARRSSSCASAARVSSSCAGIYEKQIVEVIELRSRAQHRLRQCGSCREAHHRAVRRGRVRRRDAVLLALQVGDRADPDRAADHSAGVRGEGERRRRGRVLRIRAGGSRHSRRAPADATSPCRCSARCSRTPRPSRARA